MASGASPWCHHPLRNIASEEHCSFFAAQERTTPPSPFLRRLCSASQNTFELLGKRVRGAGGYPSSGCEAA